MGVPSLLSCMPWPRQCDAKSPCLFTFPTAVVVAASFIKEDAQETARITLYTGRRWHFEMMRQRWALDKKGVVGKEINFAKNPNKIVMTGVFVFGAASNKFQSTFGIDVQVACRHANNSHPSPASVSGFLRLAWHSLQSITYTPRRKSQHTFASPQIEKKKKVMNFAHVSCQDRATPRHSCSALTSQEG